MNLSANASDEQLEAGLRIWDMPDSLLFYRDDQDPSRVIVILDANNEEVGYVRFGPKKALELANWLSEQAIAKAVSDD